MYRWSCLFIYFLSYLCKAQSCDKSEAVTITVMYLYFWDNKLLLLLLNVSNISTNTHVIGQIACSVLDIVQTLQKTLQVLSEIILDFFWKGLPTMYCYPRGEGIIRYSNTWGPILVFVFAFWWLFETEYYSYSYSGSCSPSAYVMNLSIVAVNAVK